MLSFLSVMRLLLRIGSIGVTVAVPFSAFASIADILRDDIDAWKADIEQSMNETMDDATEEEWQTADELFPAPSGENEEPAIGESTIVFRDVPRSAWFAPYVRAVAEADIMSGYRDAAGKSTEEFGVANGVTIAELAAIAVRLTDTMLDCAPPANKSAQRDWSSPYVGCAEEKGWAVYADATIDVHTPATRAQVIVTILQAFDVALGERTGTVFTDVTSSTEFASAIERAKADGIVQGYTDTNGEPLHLFGPQDPVKRVEMAKIAALAMQVYR